MPLKQLNKAAEASPMSTSSSSSSSSKISVLPPCQICADKSTGFHSGAYICDACKRFFLRSTKTDEKTGRPPTYTCAKEKNCLITKETRKDCQYCRLQKCLALGMFRKGKQEKDAKKQELKLPEIACQVCGDKSSGYHYGAFTCEGCKGFFRRSIQERNHAEYKCARDQQCAIRPGLTRKCQFCRFKKCQQVGMAENGKRMGRQSNHVKFEILTKGIGLNGINGGGVNGVNKVNNVGVNGVNNGGVKVATRGHPPEVNGEVASRGRPLESSKKRPASTSTRAASPPKRLESENGPSHLPVLAHSSPSAFTTVTSAPYPHHALSPYSYTSSPGSTTSYLALSSPSHTSISSYGSYSPGYAPGHSPLAGGSPSITGGSPASFPPVVLKPVAVSAIHQGLRQMELNDRVARPPPPRPLTPQTADFLATVRNAFVELRPVYQGPAKLPKLDGADVTFDSMWSKIMTAFKFNVHSSLKFVKKVPGFRGVRVEDQIIMVQNSMFQVILTTLSYHCNLHADHFYWFMQSELEQRFLQQEFTPFHIMCMWSDTFSNSFRELNFDQTEYSLLCALHIIDTVWKNLEDIEKIAEIKGRLCTSLKQYIEAQGGDTEGRLRDIFRKITDMRRAEKDHHRRIMQWRKERKNVKFPALWAEVHETLISENSDD